MKADWLKLKSIVVKKAEPSSVFMRSAIRAVRKWQYQPKTESGIAVPKAVCRNGFVLYGRWMRLLTGVKPSINNTYSS